MDEETQALCGQGHVESRNLRGSSDLVVNIPKTIYIQIHQYIYIQITSGKSQLLIFLKLA